MKFPFFSTGKETAIGQFPGCQGTWVDARVSRAIHKNRRWSCQQRRPLTGLEKRTGMSQSENVATHSNSDSLYSF